MSTDEETLIMNNLKLAYKLAWEYYKKCNKLIDYEELKSVSLLGLTKAVKTFKSDLQFTFATYAYKVISNELIIFIRSNKKYYFGTIKSLSTEIQDGILLGDIIPCPIDYIKELEDNIQIQQLNEAINELPERLQIIMKKHLEGYTTTEIAEMLNISQPHVSREYYKALNILRYKLGNRR